MSYISTIKSKLKNLKVGTVIFILLTIVVLTISISAGIESSRYSKATHYTSFIEKNHDKGALVYFTIDEINAPQRTIKVTSRVKLSDELFETMELEKGQLSIIFDNKNKTYKLHRNRPVETSISIDFDKGEPDNFPFDSYSVLFLFGVSIKPNSYLPVKFSSDEQFQMFHIKRVEEFYKNTGDINERIYQLEISRNILSKFSTFLIHMILWCYPICYALITSYIFVNKLQVPMVLLTFGPVMLFAMPAIREAQPNIPPVGVLIDLFGYIWSVLIISLSSIVMILCWVFRS